MDRKRLAVDGADEAKWRSCVLAHKFTQFLKLRGRLAVAQDAETDPAGVSDDPFLLG